MFLIAGLDGKIENFSGKEIKYCPNCFNERNWNLVKNTDYLSAFFIKIIPVKTRYYHQCPICNYGYEINEQEFARYKK